MLESTGVPDRIHVSEAVRERLASRQAAEQVSGAFAGFAGASAGSADDAVVHVPDEPARELLHMSSQDSYLAVLDMPALAMEKRGDEVRDHSGNLVPTYIVSKAGRAEPK